MCHEQLPGDNISNFNQKPTNKSRQYRFTGHRSDKELYELQHHLQTREKVHNTVQHNASSRSDGSDLGAVGTLNCKVSLGDIEVDQTFIICKHLRRNIILGTDFAKKNQAGISWTSQGTRVLSVRGIYRLEVEDELGIPVTTKYHVKVPPRYSAVFEVNLHRNCEGTKIISANRQLMEANPNAFQHEISVKPDGNKYNPLVAVTNLDHAKMLHLAKGEI